MQARVVFTTVNGGGAGILAESEFDVAVIDEAAQLVEAETCIMLRAGIRRCAVLAGDHKQLPVRVCSRGLFLCQPEYLLVVVTSVDPMLKALGFIIATP